MSNGAYNKKDINGLGKVLKILGEPNRLRILTSLGLECRPCLPDSQLREIIDQFRDWMNK